MKINFNLYRMKWFFRKISKTLIPCKIACTEFKPKLTYVSLSYDVGMEILYLIITIRLHPSDRIKKYLDIYISINLIHSLIGRESIRPIFGLNLVRWKFSKWVPLSSMKKASRFHSKRITFDFCRVLLSLHELYGAWRSFGGFRGIE